MKLFIAIVVTFFATLVLAAVIAVAIATRATKPTIVRVEKPTRGDLTECVSAQAEVEPKTKVQISARVAARIVELPVDEGQHVTKGDPDAHPSVPPTVLVRLDSKDLEAALRSAEAGRAALAAQLEVQKAQVATEQARGEGYRASLRQATRGLERVKTMLETNDVSQAVVDLAQREVGELEAQLAASTEALKAAQMQLVVLGHSIEGADADIARARDALSYTTITSPIDGVVTRIYAKEGETVIPGTMNNPGTVIMNVADLSKMLLVAQVDETDIGRLRAGQHAVANIHCCPDKQFEGAVDTIALTHDTGPGNARYYKTEILLKLAEDPVYSGSTAEVNIETEYHKGVLRVPSQAVLQRPVDDLPLKVRDNNPNVDTGKAYVTVVFRLVGGQAVATPVKIGPSDETRTIVQSGLTEEDNVIVGPYKSLEGLKHDQKVQDERDVAKASAAGAKPSASAAANKPGGA